MGAQVVVGLLGGELVAQLKRVLGERNVRVKGGRPVGAPVPNERRYAPRREAVGAS